MREHDTTPVTKTYLPPFIQYTHEIEKIWETGWITNSGVLVEELSRKLCLYLQVPRLELVANGTLALQLAIKVMNLTGEILTTPFSYVATTTAILWENCTPIFVDIEDKTFCIDPNRIEQAITKRTSAILATHVYGYPCDVEAIEHVARRHGLKVIYDAAHAFGVKWNGRSLLQYGDMSTLSFHATKVFHCAEGGAIACKNDSDAKKIWLRKRFGHVGEDDYREVGVNARMSELHAAMGLCVLPKIDEIIMERRRLSELYDALLAGLVLRRPSAPRGLEYNYSYYPVIFPSHESMDRTRRALMTYRVMPRRYFYPSLNTLPYLSAESRTSCPLSEQIAGRVLCLPLYVGLGEDIVNKICGIIRKEVG